MLSVPEDFKVFEWNSPFTLLLGPLYYKADPNGFEIAMCVEEKHCNRDGSVHGGVLFAMADLQLAFGIQQAVPEPLRAVTVSANINFVESARSGEWVFGRTDVHRASTHLALASCALRTSSRVVAHANGVFRITRTGPAPIMPRSLEPSDRSE